MVIPETERPDAIETVPIDIVYEPVIEPELFETVPNAVTVAPNNESEPFAVNDQLLLFVYEPDRFSVVPPSTSAPEPVKPWPCVHVMVKLLTVIPVATARLFIAIVYEPVIEPELFETVPDAVTVDPNNESEPFAVNDQLLLSV